MTASYLIGLREGLEAALVVSVLVAFLVKSDRRQHLRLVWAGVAVAVAVSIGLGALLTYTSAALTHEQQELFDAIASLVAVVFVTWMIFWMRRAARRIGGELRAKLEEAINVGPLAIAAMAFFAVAREGLETAVLFFSAVRATAGSGAGPLLAISAGLITAAGLGWLLYLSAMRINLGTFFRWTGALLVLVAAGILKYAVHDLQEAGVLPGLDTHAFDLTGVVSAGAWYAELLRGMFNFTLQPSVLETLAWFGYASSVLILFLRPGRPARQPQHGPKPAAQQAVRPAVRQAARPAAQPATSTSPTVAS